VARTVRTRRHRTAVNNEQLSLFSSDTFVALTPEPPDPNSPCYDCGVPTTPPGRKRDIAGRWEYYVVWPAAWRAGGGGSGYLCIGCLERRLGRR
jgi:hypothetical protein